MQQKEVEPSTSIGARQADVHLCAGCLVGRDPRSQPKLFCAIDRRLKRPSNRTLVENIPRMEVKDASKQDLEELGRKSIFLSWGNEAPLFHPSISWRESVCVASFVLSAFRKSFVGWLQERLGRPISYPGDLEPSGSNSSKFPKNQQPIFSSVGFPFNPEKGSPPPNLT